MSEFVMTIGEEHLTIDLDRMKLSESAQCERLTGMTVPEWIGAFFQTRSVAVQFGYWLARERAGNPVVFGDIDFDLGDFDFAMTEEGELPEVPTLAPVSVETPPAKPSKPKGRRVMGLELWQLGVVILLFLCLIAVVAGGAVYYFRLS